MAVVLVDIDLQYWTSKVEHIVAFTAFQQHLYCACAETAIYELGVIVVPNLVKIDAVVSII